MKISTYNLVHAIKNFESTLLYFRNFTHGSGFVKCYTLGIVIAKCCSRMFWLCQSSNLFVPQDYIVHSLLFFCMMLTMNVKIFHVTLKPADYHFTSRRKHFMIWKYAIEILIIISPY
jgi:hypothetical protein